MTGLVHNKVMVFMNPLARPFCPSDGPIGPTMARIQNFNRDRRDDDGDNVGFVGFRSGFSRDISFTPFGGLSLVTGLARSCRVAVSHGADDELFGPPLLAPLVLLCMSDMPDKCPIPDREVVCEMLHTCLISFAAHTKPLASDRAGSRHSSRPGHRDPEWPFGPQPP